MSHIFNTDYVFDAELQKNRIIDWIKEYFADNGPNSPAVIGMSGGKDSAVCAALCTAALGKNRVYGIIIPNGDMRKCDMDCAKDVCNILGINCFTVNIGDTTKAIYDAFNNTFCDYCPTPFDYKINFKDNSVVTTNLPARIRMTTLYAIAAALENGGRVVNTCNLSEDYIGYFTKYGDGAGDFSPLADYTATEVCQIGYALGLPDYIVGKAPDDGMCGKTDEENFGFTYKELDNYIRYRIIPEDVNTLAAIKHLHSISRHKDNINIPFCRHFVPDEWSF